MGNHLGGGSENGPCSQLALESLLAVHGVPENPQNHRASSESSSVDPLVMAAQHNLTRSPLCRLPDAVVVNIIRNLNRYYTIECLRRVSRVFLRLVPQVFPDMYESVPSNRPVTIAAWGAWYQRVHHWGKARDPQTLPSDVQSALARLLQKDMYCDGCRTARAARDWGEKLKKATKEYLHCSACRIDHPACLFSAQGRSNPTETRICIGHEGFLRLCRHKVIRWSDLCPNGRAPNDRDSGWPMLSSIASCEHPDHVFRCGKRRVISILFPCRPGAKLSYKNRTSPATLRLTWIPEIHLETKEGQTLTADGLRSRLAELRADAGCFICPESKPGELIELLWFDPNRRDVGIQFEGAHTINWKLVSQPRVGSNLDRTPPQDPQTPGELGAFVQERKSYHPKSVAYPEELIKSRAESQKVSSLRMTLAGTIDYFHVGVSRLLHGCSTKRMRLPKNPIRGHFSMTKTPFGPDWSGGVSRVIVEGHFCGHTYASIEFERHVVIFGGDLPLRMSPNWYHSLDPDSYNLKDDQDGFGVYWCLQPRCANYYRYVLTRKLEKHDYHRPCNADCERISTPHGEPTGIPTKKEDLRIGGKARV
jgi:hypothetical protein